MSADTDLVRVAAAVRALHRSERDVCAECGRRWPCRTVQVLEDPPR